MKNELNSIRAGVSASIIGSGHNEHGLPCQLSSDAESPSMTAPIVCDGRGSTSCSQDDASAAISIFTSQCTIFEPMAVTIQDQDHNCRTRSTVFFEKERENAGTARKHDLTLS